MVTSLKRHTSLKPLSRDHGVGLVCVQGLQRAVRASRQERIRTVQEMKSVCNHIILSYLNDEEALLPALISDRHLLQKFQEHHAQIRRLAGALDKSPPHEDPGLGLLARLSDAIDNYVRWEEHALFPAMELSLTADQLSDLWQSTLEMESRRNRPTQTMHHSAKLKR